ncbi:hypothetical protein B0H34DRAFT_56490 [Crassisporium funariophilum]|nr:hypothetical protein B0H34DRAFT_56490 [Crassisporium funariophilum]
MVFDPASATHLKPWLVRTLEPICDAEPGALADYILALLRHNVPESEMRKELAVQLDEFLEKAECNSFIDTMFTVLRTKSYLPYSAATASPSFTPKSLDTGIPIPLDGLMQSAPPQERTRKRSNTNDERDGRPPAKGPRLNNEGQFSRYGNGGGDGRMGQSTGGWNRPQMDRFQNGGMVGGMGGFAGPMGGMVMNGMGGRRPQSYQPPDQKRGICRDYHNNGYCARGAMCKYSHGEDAVIPNQLFPMNGMPGGAGMPFMPMFAGAMGNMNGMFAMQGAYDPHEARMDMRGGRQHQRAPILPRIQQEDGSHVIHPINASGELPVIQDLTPISPPEVPSAEPLPQGDTDMQQPNQLLGDQMSAGGNYDPMLGNMGNMNGNAYQQPTPSMDVDMAGSSSGMRPPVLHRGGYRGGAGRGNGGGGRGRGTFGGEVHNFRPEKRNDQTLVVEKIPEDKLSLGNVNDWFKRFGTVTHVAIDPMTAKALVSFSNHEEAHAAWKSQDAVFGNRFVKVFWHRPMEGHGQVGARMLAASAPLVGNLTKISTTTSTASSPPIDPASSTSSARAAPVRKPSITPASTGLALKQQLLEQKIAEQKALMASLSTASVEEKKEIMARLRKLGEETSKLTASNVASESSGVSAAVKKPVVGDKTSEQERKEKERLDKELDMNTAVDEEHHEETTEDLKAKLEKLKAEAASLGLDAPLASSSSGAYRGYRGRGRGAPRSYIRGAPVFRGGPQRASMKLDNRPKKLVVKGVQEDESQALKDWYETTGQLDTVEPSEGGAYIVSFKSRSAAEQGLAKGLNIPIVGSVQVSWYTGSSSSPPTSVTAPVKTVPKPSPTSLHPSSSGIAVAEGSNGSERARSPDVHHSHLQDEEIVASGWGGDGDDGDGMGML